MEQISCLTKNHYSDKVLLILITGFCLMFLVQMAYAQCSTGWTDAKCKTSYPNQCSGNTPRNDIVFSNCNCYWPSSTACTNGCVMSGGRAVCSMMPGGNSGTSGTQTGFWCFTGNTGYCTRAYVSNGVATACVTGYATTCTGGTTCSSTAKTCVASSCESGSTQCQQYGGVCSPTDCGAQGKVNYGNLGCPCNRYCCVGSGSGSGSGGGLGTGWACTSGTQCQSGYCAPDSSSVTGRSTRVCCASGQCGLVSPSGNGVCYSAGNYKDSAGNTLICSGGYWSNSGSSGNGGSNGGNSNYPYCGGVYGGDCKLSLASCASTYGANYRYYGTQDCFSGWFCCGPGSGGSGTSGQACTYSTTCTGGQLCCNNYNSGAGTCCPSGQCYDTGGQIYCHTSGSGGGSSMFCGRCTCRGSSSCCSASNTVGEPAYMDSSGTWYIGTSANAYCATCQNFDATPCNGGSGNTNCQIAITTSKSTYCSGDAFDLTFMVVCNGALTDITNYRVEVNGVDIGEVITRVGTGTYMYTGMGGYSTVTGARIILVTAVVNGVSMTNTVGVTVVGAGGFCPTNGGNGAACPNTVASQANTAGCRCGTQTSSVGNTYCCSTAINGQGQLYPDNACLQNPLSCMQLCMNNGGGGNGAACTNTVASQANTAGCTCGTQTATAGSTYCCAASSQLYPDNACSQNPLSCMQLCMNNGGGGGGVTNCQATCPGMSGTTTGTITCNGQTITCTGVINCLNSVCTCSDARCQGGNGNGGATTVTCLPCTRGTTCTCTVSGCTAGIVIAAGLSVNGIVAQGNVNSNPYIFQIPTVTSGIANVRGGCWAGGVGAITSTLVVS